LGGGLIDYLTNSSCISIRAMSLRDLLGLCLKWHLYFFGFRRHSWDPYRIGVRIVGLLSLHRWRKLWITYIIIIIPWIQYLKW